jgi:plasmid stabilization system protein ParE
MHDRTDRRELFQPFGRGGYVLRYMIRNQTVVIIRVWHAKEWREDR